MKQMLDGMMKGIDGDDFDSLAQNLLKGFMDKEILYQPLQEAEQNYLTYFKDNEGKISESDQKNYDGQLECVRELIKTLEDTPDDKDKMITTFERMHEHGMPPEGVLKPLNGIPGLDGNDPTLGGGNQGMPGMPGMDPKDMQNCNIF